MITVKDFLEKITNPDRIRGPFTGHSGSGNGIFQNRSGDPGEGLEGARPYGPDRTGTGAGL